MKRKLEDKFKATFFKIKKNRKIFQVNIQKKKMKKKCLSEISFEKKNLNII